MKIFQNELEKHGTARGYFFTHPAFWECECDDNFVHPKAEKMCLGCGCNIGEDDVYPDARIEDMKRLLNVEVVEAP